METELSQNKMGTTPIKRLMPAMGLPMILSMMLQAFYNIVDSYFVSAMEDTAEIAGMGDYGANALTLAFPIQMLMIAVGVGTGVGINALLSRSLGQGERERASQIAGNAVFLGLCTYVVFLLVGLFGVDAYLRSQTSDPIVLQMGTDYLRICTIFSFGAIVSMIYEKLLQSTGRTGLSMAAQIAGALVNIILDPILIFGYFGCPRLGIAGAAYATVIGQVFSLIVGIVFHHALNREVDGSLKYLRPRLMIIRQIYQIGVPAIIMQALMSVMTYGINIIFGRVSSAAVTAYGVYYKIQQFVFFAAFGMNNALMPIVAYNYGLGNRQRVKDGIKYGLGYTVLIMMIGAVGLQLFAKQLIGLFPLQPETTDLCIRAVRVITLGYLFVGANVAYQGIFQAFGNGMRSLYVSLTRLIIVALPLAYFLTTLSNAEEVIWLAFPIAEAAAFVLAVVLMRKVAREKVALLEPGQGLPCSEPVQEA